MDDVELPKGWIECELKNLIDVAQSGDWGVAPSLDDARLHKAICFRAADIKQWKYIKGVNGVVRSYAKERLESRILINGDILVEMSGGGPEQPVGRVIHIDNEVVLNNKMMPKICSNFMKQIRLNSNINNICIFYYLDYYYNAGKTIPLQSGSNNLRNLNWNKYSLLNLPLPPLNEQNRIVAKLEELLSEVDAGIAQLKKAQEQLVTYRQSVLKYAFEGKLTEDYVPEGELQSGWVETQLGNIIFEISQGWSPKCNNFNTTDPDTFAVITTTAIQHINFYPYENKVLPASIPPKLKHLIKTGDILITRAGPRDRVGVCCLVKEVKSNLINCDKSYRLIINNEIVDSSFFVYQLNSEHYRKLINEIKTGINDSGLNLTQNNFVLLPFYLPTLNQQIKIVQTIEQRFSEVDNLNNTISNALVQAESLKQSILAHAFSGKLVDQDPTDEPANELLARIIAEREAKEKEVKLAKKAKSKKPEKKI